MIPAMYNSLMQDEEDTPATRQKMQQLANDYCVDGCWEPILNGKSDWTFTMLVGDASRRIRHEPRRFFKERRSPLQRSQSISFNTPTQEFCRSA